MFKTLFSAWHFDLVTALLTVVIGPLLLYMAALLRKYLKNWGAYALEGLLYWCSRILKRSIARTLTLKRYSRLRLAEDNQYLLVPSSLDIKLPIDSAYVTLALDHSAASGSTFDHRSLLSIGNRIRVIGDPGSGKSSLVKRVFRDACYNAIAPRSTAQLPMLVELKHLPTPPDHADSSALGSWFIEYLRGVAAQSRVYRMDECFDTYAEGPGLLLLLDGLDEVSTSHYTRVQAAILALSTTLGQMSDNSIILLTMRTQFHQQIQLAFRDAFGHVLVLRPFSPSDIYEFLTRWPFARADKDQAVGRIYGDLTDRPTLREMCSNPLVLAMYVAEDQTAGRIVAPESRTEFYSKVTDELLIKRRFKQTGPTPAHTALREQRERILGRLAYEHILNLEEPANALNWKLAVEVVSEVMRCSADEAESIFRNLAKETGLITEERIGEQFRFIHLTFCEFLAAHEAVQGRREGWASLLRCHENILRRKETPQALGRLVEVIPFACGLLPRIERDAAITAVSLLEDDALLARCFLETKSYAGPEWPKFAERQRSRFVASAESSWDDQWLRDLHLFNVVVRDATQCASHLPLPSPNVDLDAFFQSLIGGQKRSLERVLEAYASQDAAAMFRLAELSNLDIINELPDSVIDNCDQPPFLALVVGRALKEPARIERWAALISEAALRSRVVTRALSRMSTDQALEQMVRATPQEMRWGKTGILPGTLHSQLLTISMNGNTLNEERFRCVNIIKRVRTPSTLLNRTPFVIIGASILALTLAVTVLCWGIPTRMHKGDGGLGLLALIGVVIAYVFIFADVAKTANRIMLRALVMPGWNLEYIVANWPHVRQPAIFMVFRPVLRFAIRSAVPRSTQEAVFDMLRERGVARVRAAPNER